VVLIASHEARNGWRDGRFLLAVSVILGLLVLSLLSVIPRHRSQLQDTERLTASERDRWLNQGNKTPHGAAHFGWYLAKPIGPLAVFDEGVNTYAGVFAHLEPHDQRIFRFRPAEDLPWLRRLGTLTAAVTLQHLLPFLILVLSFGTFASPEARATGRLLMSTGVRVRNVLVGRALGTALPWLTVCAVFVAIGGLALVLAGPTRGDTFLRVALVAVAYLVYQAVFVAVSLTVSLWAPSARVALSSLLAFWVCTGFIVPAVAIEAAERLDPAPAPLAFAAAMNTERYALPPWYERLGSIERRLLRQYGKSHVDDLPVSASGVGLVEEEADQDRLLDRHFHGLFDAHERQAVHLQRAAIASPLLAIRSLSAGLAGTDVTDHIAFARAAETYRRSAVQLLNKDTAVNDLPGNRTDLGVPGITTKYYQPGRELWEKVPVFRYEPPSATAVLRDRLGAALALGLWLLAAAGACAWRAGRDIER
jgi:ABC-2 type transport system permease protein